MRGGGQPPPLHKEDTASMDEARMDSVAHPLSLSGQDECVMAHEAWSSHHLTENCSNSS